MQSRRLATTSVSFLAALSLATAACNATGPGSATATPTPSGSATSVDARQALAGAVTEMGKTSYKVSLTAGPASGTGSMDPTGQQGQLAMSVFAGSTTMKIDTVLAGPDMWVKLTGIPAIPDKWLHLDAKRLPEGAGVGLGVRPGQLDPARADRLVAAVTDVQQTGTGTFKGTLDLTRATGSGALDKSTVDALGDRARSIPFEATVDAQGRLTNFKLDLGQVRGISMKVDVTYSDFGAPVTVTRPAAADVVEAPEAVYTVLGG